MMDDIDTLAALLAERSDGAIEETGATALFKAISGDPLIRIEVLARRTRLLTADECRLLRAGAAASGHERRGMLRTSTGVPVADTTSVLLPGRIPAKARAELGIPDHRMPLPPRTRVPLGRALRGFGVRREPLRVQRTDARLDASGQEQIIYSAARLWLGPGPIGLATERVYRRFVEAFPSPWCALSQRNRPL